MTLKGLKNLHRTLNKKTNRRTMVDPDRSYAAGFIKACDDHDQDPEMILEVAKLLELQL